MGCDDEQNEFRTGLRSTDRLPPDDWAGFAREARIEIIYAAHGPTLTRFFRSRADRQDVGDLVQECFRRLLGNQITAAWQINKPRSYLIRIARNLMTEQNRADGRNAATRHEPFDETALGGPDPLAALEARDAIRRVQEAVAKMKPRTRDIFLMHRIDGMSYKEIASVEGISVKGVEKQIAKAMINIRRMRDGRR